MKNILIFGVGRAGKTTLSRILKEKYPRYNLIQSDSIKWGIITAKGLEEEYTKYVEKQKEFEHGELFQNILLEIFNYCIEDDKNQFGYILESGQLNVKNIASKIDFNKTAVICLGHGELDKQGIIKLCRKYDTKEDWSYYETDEDLDKHAEKWSEMNKEIEEECKRYNIKYIDTSKDRKQALNDAFKYISNEIKR